MDTVGALTAPLLVTLDVDSIDAFLKGSSTRVIFAHGGGRSFGPVLKTLLHGRLGSALRCGRLDLSTLPPDDDEAAARFAAWIELAGTRDAFPPPEGYYVFRGPKLMGFHPPADEDLGAFGRLAFTGTRGLWAWARTRDAIEAGRQVLGDGPEFAICCFLEEAARAATPRRAPTASDRRQRTDRRDGGTRGSPRRAREKLEAELGGAFGVLGVSATTPLKTVRQVRNQLMRKHHPDRLSDQPERAAEATTFVMRINEAYAVIRRAHEAGALL
ncbi:MAG: J domain-containing protein [Proteobacteria bacterium]|nr:J domain-containing protein [Pseudomonadota bacterium]